MTGFLLVGGATLVWMPLFSFSAQFMLAMAAVIAGCLAAAFRWPLPGLALMTIGHWVYAILFFTGADAGSAGFVATGIAAGLTWAFLGVLRGDPLWMVLGMATAGVVQMVWVVGNLADGAVQLFLGNVLFSAGCFMVSFGTWTGDDLVAPSAMSGKAA